MSSSMTAMWRFHSGTVWRSMHPSPRAGSSRDRITAATGDRSSYARSGYSGDKKCNEYGSETRGVHKTVTATAVCTTVAVTVSYPAI